jgi:hypothetical protein
MYTYKYQIVEDSGKLWFEDLDVTFFIGSRVLEAFMSRDEYRVLGAKKRFTHEWWHYLFTNLSYTQQESLVNEFKSKVLGNSDKINDLVEFYRLLYQESESYGFHFPQSIEDFDMFAEDGECGTKVSDIVEIIPGEKVFAALFLTELLSISSESETEFIDDYYLKVEPIDVEQHIIWDRKRQLGKLARSLVEDMNPIIETEFKVHTAEGLRVLQSICNEVESRDSIEKGAINKS